MGDQVFEALLEHPEGMWVGRVDEDQFGRLKTEDGRINVVIEELENVPQEMIFFVDDNICVDQHRARTLFERLWWYDQVVFDASSRTASPPRTGSPTE